MTTLEALASIEGRLRPTIIHSLSPRQATRLYSAARKEFLTRYVEELPSQYVPPKSLERTLWGITFRAPLFNADGMFKDGKGYRLAYLQGAGAFAAGTFVGPAWPGNTIEGIENPALMLPSSRSALNCIGLKHPGDIPAYDNLAVHHSMQGCPKIVSVSAPPDKTMSAQDKRKYLLYTAELALGTEDVSMLVVNMSCPNRQDRGAGHDIRAIRSAFPKEEYATPIIIKLGPDLNLSEVPALIEDAVREGYDGLEFANTSTDYAALRPEIDLKDRPYFDWFTTKIGGGFSGPPVSRKVAHLVAESQEALQRLRPDHEFNLIWTGGIFNGKQMSQLESQYGVKLFTWYGGHFAAFGKHGHGLYKHVLEEYAEAIAPQARSSVR